MATFTISIPKELKEKMDSYPEINLAEYLKKRFQFRLKELTKFEALKIHGVLESKKFEVFFRKLRNKRAT